MSLRSDVPCASWLCGGGPGWAGEVLILGWSGLAPGTSHSLRRGSGSPQGDPAALDQSPNSKQGGSVFCPG